MVALPTCRCACVLKVKTSWLQAIKLITVNPHAKGKPWFEDDKQEVAL